MVKIRGLRRGQVKDIKTTVLRSGKDSWSSVKRPTGEKTDWQPLLERDPGGYL